MAFVAAGFADFPLIAYHFQKASILSADWIPLFYAIAMAVDGVAALLFGRLFDRIGLSILIVVSLISALFAPLVFCGGFTLALLGMVCWGVGMGAQESIMRAAIAGFVPANRRGSAYGIFNAGYGLFWFFGQRSDRDPVRHVHPLAGRLLGRHAIGVDPCVAARPAGDGLVADSLTTTQPASAGPT